MGRELAEKWQEGSFRVSENILYPVFMVVFQKFIVRNVFIEC